MITTHHIIAKSFRSHTNHHENVGENYNNRQAFANLVFGDFLPSHQQRDLHIGRKISANDTAEINRHQEAMLMMMMMICRPEAQIIIIILVS